MCACSLQEFGGSVLEGALSDPGLVGARAAEGTSPAFVFTSQWVKGPFQSND